MGNSCDTSTPDDDNRCSDKLGEQIESGGFCTISGSAGDKYRKNYCDSLSDGEWEFSGNGESCNYNSCNNNQRMQGGCCIDGSTCCGTAGNATKCKRTQFKGDPLICCFRDMACNKDEEYCFQGNGKKRTCAPEYRNMASTGCRDKMFDYCTGKDIPKGYSNIWINRWIGTEKISNEITVYQPCYKNIYRNLYDGQLISCSNNASESSGLNNKNGYFYAQNLVNTMISRYIQEGGDIAASESSESNTQLNDMIYKICSKNPGICQKSLFRYCSNITPNDIERNTNLLTWCGCYMSPDIYSKYTELYGIDRECTPLCNTSTSIPLSTVDGNSIKKCNNTTCIIDDINIKISNSVVGGNGISFSQLCNSCGAEQGGYCNCTITDGNFQIIDAKTGGISIPQQCSAESTCYKEIVDKKDPEKKSIIKVPCNGTDDVDYEEIEKISQQNYENSIFRKNIFIIIIFIILFIVFIIIWLFVSPIETSDVDLKLSLDNISAKKYLGLIKP